MKMQAFNPFLPEYEYVPDGEPYVFGDRIYVFGSHDRFNGKGYCENDYVGWSAPVDDLGDWRYEGVIFRKDQDPLNADGPVLPLYAPDIQRGKDGRYYLYYPTHSGTSVAVCDTPAGAYEFYGHVCYPDGSRYGKRPGGDIMAADPATFMDVDGQLYLYTGYTPMDAPSLEHCKRAGRRYHGAYCVRLEDDMKTVRGEAEMIVPGWELAPGTEFEGHGFYEASSMRLIRGRYYFIYSSSLSHELCYAVSDRPDGGFHYGGTVISNGDVGYGGSQKAKNQLGNVHGSIVEVGGHYYIFYHRHTNRCGYCRQACAEEIFFLEDGSIPQVEITCCGLNSSPLRGEGRYRAAIACNIWSDLGRAAFITQDGEDGDTCARQYLSELERGGRVGYKYFDFSGDEGTVTLTYRGNSDGYVLISCDDPDGEAVASIKLEVSEGWTDARAAVRLPRGKHALFFRLEGDGAIDILEFELRK